MKWFLPAICLAAFAGHGAEYARVSFEKECAAGSALCCQMLQKRIERRTPPSDCAKTLNVKFALDGAVKGEDAVVVVALNLLLRWMQRQRAQIVGTERRYTQLN